jgi:hypothetical protein
MKFSALLAVSVLAAIPLAAQDADELVHAPDLGTYVRVNGIQILPAVNKPFTGRDHIEWTRTLEDGSMIASELYAVLARDSQGRIYREHMTFVPVNSGQPIPRRQFDLLDPVAHTRTICITATRHCTISDYHVSPQFKLPPPGTFDEGKRTLVRESIGTDVIDGLNVIGTRETITISTGAVGNSQPLISTREFWYSPDLEINLSTLRKDPREGQQAIRVLDLSRTDPAADIFKIPANYTVEDIRQSVKF